MLRFGASLTMFQLVLLWVDVLLISGLALLSGSGDKCRLGDVRTYVNQTYTDAAMEAFPFKISDYNRDVRANYPGEKGLGMTLNYPNANTMAFIILYDEDDHDKASTVSSQVFESIKKHYAGTCFNGSSIRYIEANKLQTTSTGLTLPIVHVQTAGHAAGAAFYLQRHHVSTEPDDWAGKAIYGFSAHKDFGVNTRFAGVIVFEELSDPDFVAPAPHNDATTDEAKIKLLNEFNAFGRR